MNSHQELIALNILRKAERQSRCRELLRQSSHAYYLEPRKALLVGVLFLLIGMSGFVGFPFPQQMVGIAICVLVFGMEQRRQSDRLDALIELLKMRGDLEHADKG